MQLALLGASIYDIFESLDSRTCLYFVTSFLSYLLLKFFYYVDIHFLFWTWYWNYKASRVQLPDGKPKKEFHPHEHFGDVHKYVEESLNVCFYLSLIGLERKGFTKEIDSPCKSTSKISI